MLEYCLDMMESGVKGWVEYTNEELAEELNILNTDADWLYENEEDENGEECPVIFEVYNGEHR
jgi:orotate phosphoribosyltransferase-like protein